MADDTPTHRSGFPSRSGDTHEIGKDGKLRNVDNATREETARPPRRRRASGSHRKPARARAAPAPTPAPTPSGESSQ